MDSDESLVIPPLGKEHHVWHIPEDAPVSRSRRSRGNGEYESTIPISLADLRFVFPSELLADCEEASCALASFDAYAAAKLGEGSHVLGPMSAVLLRTEASSSSQIENLTVGAKNLALETIDEGTSDNAAVVVGNVRAMEAALKLGDSMTENNILAMHEALLSAQRGWGKYAGTYRTNLVWVGTDGYSPRGAAHVGPQPELIAGAMADLLEFIERDDLSVVAQCAIAHAQFETIHPFLDGNGRLGRLLITLMLCDSGILKAPILYLSLFFKVHRQEYYRLLSDVRSTGDWEAWLSYFLEAVTLTSRQAVTTARQIARQISDDRKIIEQTGRSSATTLLIFECFTRKLIADSKYIVAETGLSPATVNSGLARLQELYIVSEITGKKRDKIYSYARCMEVLNQELDYDTE